MSFEPESPFLRQQIRETLHSHEPDYTAGESVYDQVSNKFFTGVIGPIGIGKTTLVNEVLHLEPTLRPINTTTTRHRKPEDPKTFKTAEDGITFSSFRDAVNKRELVNYSVIPGADIYGTFPDDFPTKYTIGPLLPSGVEQIARAGFEDTHFVYVVTPGEIWRHFVEKNRNALPSEKFKARMNEAIDSIMFAQEQTHLLTFLENKAGLAGFVETSQKLADLALFRSHESLSEKEAHIQLESMLATATDLAVH